MIFETTEWSWHAFPRINLPAGKQDLTRKSIALYFYTKDRPADELADMHSTIYVDQPFPERFQPGMTIDAADIEELQVLLRRRDQHNQRLYREISSLSNKLDLAQTALNRGFLGRVDYFARRVLGRFMR